MANVVGVGVAKPAVSPHPPAENISSVKDGAGMVVSNSNPDNGPAHSNWNRSNTSWGFVIAYVLADSGTVAKDTKRPTSPAEQITIT